MKNIIVAVKDTAGSIARAMRAVEPDPLDEMAEYDEPYDNDSP